MIFSQLEFFIFFAVVLLGLCFMRSNTPRKVWLLAASYYFYAYWDWRFLSLILISTAVDYAIGLGLKNHEDKRIRRALLIISLCVNLGILGFFKYFNFFIESAQPLLQGMGLHVGTLNIILPVGISFYTFQTLSYSIDVYRRRMPAHESLLDFALFVGFFPQLVAGPIVRASHFLPQLTRYSALTSRNAYVGFQRFTYGLFKKVFLADRLALFADNVFVNAGGYDCATTWMGAIAYTLQIYFDFSGYSDMAIGIARVLGYDLGENFNFPYLSRNLQEFWRRWHISLSTWIRDYLYIPLGGNRKGPVRTYINLVGTMLLCGLWHGAAWTFVVWGGLHGAGMAVNRLWRNLFDRQPQGRLVDMLCWSVTMLFVVVGWVIFRAPDFGKAWLMLRQMFAPQPGIEWFFPFVPAVAVATALVHGIKQIGCWEGYFLPEQARWYSPALLFSLLWLVVIFYPQGFTPFIYFQF